MDSPLALQEQSDLSEEESRLLYNVEVLGLNVKRAGELAGVSSPNNVLKRAHVMVAQEQLRNALRVRVQITREDVIAGLKDAVDQAKILADPMAQIAGWREIAKILGYDKTPTINVHLSGSAAQIRQQVQQLSTQQLLEMSGNEKVIDADFYRQSVD